jgi:glycosyltransferase involved in cell wall biosynthesis
MESSGWLRDAGGVVPRTGQLAAIPEPAPALSADVSVVIPCLDAAELLPLQLEALARQVWQGAWEVIIADNGSTDRTPEIALSFAGRLPALRVVDASAHRGRHYACNVGFRAARGSAVVFVDADDEVAPSYISAMAEALQDHHVVAARLDHLALDPEWMQGVGSGFQTTGLEDGFGFLPFGAGCSLGFQRSVFEAVGGFRERATFCEDVDISWRMQLAGYRIEFVPDAVVHYRSRTTLRAMFRQHRNFGRSRALLYHDYRAAGMPPRPSRTALNEWLFIARALFRIRSRAEAARWSRRLGRCVGRLQGSLRYRVWYP